MATDRSECLDIIISEQHRDLEYLLHIYNRMRSGQNILLTAAFALLAYLYTANNEDNASIVERFFIPDDDYGKVIYFIAAGFFVYGVIKLMVNVFGQHPWTTAYESSKENYTNDTVKVREYYKERNDLALKTNTECYYKRKRELTFLFYSVTISAILLIVMKTLN